MSHFQNKNKIWINNTLKSASEVAKVLKILKDVGVFREKPRRRSRKPKQPKEEEMPEGDEEFLVPPSGGGGGDGPSGASVGLLPTSNITQALQALKSGVSSQAQQQATLEKAKEDLQLQYGRMLDLSQQQNRFADLRPSQLQIEDVTDWLEEETGKDFFPQKDPAVAETNYEFKKEGLNNVSDEALDIDVSEKVSPEEGVVEEEEQTGFVASPAEITLSEKLKILTDQYGLGSLRKNMSRDELQNYLRNMYIKFNRKAPATAISRMRKDELKKAITDLIALQYDFVYD